MCDRRVLSFVGALIASACILFLAVPIRADNPEKLSRTADQLDLTVSVLFEDSLSNTESHRDCAPAALYIWSVGGGPRPEKFEGVVSVANTGQIVGENVEVEVKVRFKVGPFPNPPGPRRAEWQPPVYEQKLKFGQLEPGSHREHWVPIDLTNTLTPLWEQNRWVWFVELSARVTSASTDAHPENDLGVATLVLEPGD